MPTVPGRRLGESQEQVLTPQIPLASQIAAQELSDNRVITLSLAGRKLDKKVRRAKEGVLLWGAVSLPQACIAQPFSFWPPLSLPLPPPHQGTSP